MKEATTWKIARMAECDAPNDPNGIGAKWLEGCFSTAKELNEELQGLEGEEYDNRINELAHEFADHRVPIYTHELWYVWVELGGFGFDGEYRDFSSHGDTGDRMNRIAQADCYEWARNIMFFAQPYFRGTRDY